MQVLVINSGSSSIKFRLVEVVEAPMGVRISQPALLQGAVKGIGTVASFEVAGQDGHRSTTTLEIRDHAHVVAADEETWIARERVRCVRNVYS
jgi:acetate kinase